MTQPTRLPDVRQGGDTPSHPPALPPGLALYQMSIGHYVSRALHLAAKREDHQ